MSVNGRESLLRLRALTQRFAAPVAAFAESGVAESALDRLAGNDAVPIVGFDPFGDPVTARSPRAAATPAPRPARDTGPAVSTREGASPAGGRPHAEIPGRIGAGASPSPRLAEGLPERRETPVAPGRGSGLREGADPPVFRLGGARGAAAPTSRPPGREEVERSEPVRKSRAEPSTSAEPVGPGAGTAPAPEASISRPDWEPLPAPPLPVSAEPVGLELVASLLRRLDAAEAPTDTPEDSGPGKRKAILVRPLPPRERARLASPPGAAPSSGETALESAGGAAKGGAGPLDRGPLSGSPLPWPGLPFAPEPLRPASRIDRASLSLSPSAEPVEPVGLGLVSGLLARIGPEGGGGNTQRGSAPASRAAVGAPPALRSRERGMPPGGAETPRAREVFAGLSVPAARPNAEPPLSPSSLPGRPVGEAGRLKAPAEAAPFGGLAASYSAGDLASGGPVTTSTGSTNAGITGSERRSPAPVPLADPLADSLEPRGSRQGGSAPDLAESPLLATQPLSPALDPDLLADLVNDALVAQAVRFGVDLS